MAGTYETRLNEMGYTVPDAPAPAANYVPYVVIGDMVYVSGQIAKGSDGVIVGKLDLDRLQRVVKLGGFVNSTPDFTDHPAVVNGASDFIGEVFGDAGAHARAAVGCSSLPMGVAVEVEGIFQIS